MSEERTGILRPLMSSFPLGFQFSRYAAIREVKFRSGAGKLDLCVVTDEPSLLLIEAKQRRSKDSKAKVLGQLIYYLAHALECSDEITTKAMLSASTSKMNQRPGFWNGSSRESREPERKELAAWIQGAIGSGSAAPRIRAFVALDEWQSDRDERRLLVPVSMLAKHKLPIYIVLKNGQFVFRPEI